VAGGVDGGVWSGACDQDIKQSAAMATRTPRHFLTNPPKGIISSQSSALSKTYRNIFEITAAKVRELGSFY